MSLELYIWKRIYLKMSQREINTLNNDKSIHGILVQLPLPSHIDEDAVISAIDPMKDVDGFHP